MKICSTSMLNSQHFLSSYYELVYLSTIGLSIPHSHSELYYSPHRQKLLQPDLMVLVKELCHFRKFVGRLRGQMIFISSWLLIMFCFLSLERPVCDLHLCLYVLLFLQQRQTIHFVLYWQIARRVCLRCVEMFCCTSYSRT